MKSGSEMKRDIMTSRSPWSPFSNKKHRDVFGVRIKQFGIFFAVFERRGDRINMAVHSSERIVP